MMCRSSSLFACVIASAAVSMANADYRIVLRGNAEPVTAVGFSASLRGVEARPSGTLVPWDMVRAIEDLNGVPTSEATALDFLSAGEDLWRARIRIDRGDELLAQSMLAKHWDRFRLADGPSTSLVAEGMLRCALATGDIRAAVEPWLVCLRLGSAGDPSRFPQLAPVIDDTTGLLPALSPFVPASSRADLAAACDTLASAAGAPTSLPAEVAARIARMVRATDGAALASATAAADNAAPAVRALALLEVILAAPDERACARAVTQFEQTFQDAPAFLTAWKLAARGAQSARMARTAKGNSTPAQLNAQLEAAALAMLAVPASGFDHAGLVELYALEEAHALLRESGDAVSAQQVATLRDEVKRELELKNTTSATKPANAKSAGAGTARTN